MYLPSSVQDDIATQIANYIRLNTADYTSAAGAHVSYPTHRPDAGRVTSDLLSREHN